MSVRMRRTTTGWEHLFSVRRVWRTGWRKFAVYKLCADSCAAVGGHTWFERLTKPYIDRRIALRRRSWCIQMFAANRM